MKNSTKYLLAGGVVAAGVAYWWWSSNQHQEGAAQIVTQPPLTPSITSPPIVISPSPTIPVSPASPTGTLTSSQQQELSALMAWTTQTKNPALYQQMMQQLTGSQLDQLYSILTTQWEVSGAVPTAANTTFWNQLRQQYPFLNTGGVNPQGQLCQTFNCNP